MLLIKILVAPTTIIQNLQKKYLSTSKKLMNVFLCAKITKKNKLNYVRENKETKIKHIIKYFLLKFDYMNLIKRVLMFIYDH